MKKRNWTDEKWILYLGRKSSLRDVVEIIAPAAVAVGGIAVVIVALMVMVYALMYDVKVASLLLKLAGGYAALIALAVIFDSATRFTREEISMIHRLNLKIATYPHFKLF